MNHTLYLRGLTLAIFASFAYLLAVPVWDSDFWWHLAAGRHIIESGSIPDSDPFGVFHGGNEIRNNTVLKGQWLGQVLLYGIFNLAQLDAIVWARVMLLLGSLYLVYRRLMMFRLRPWIISTMTVLAGLGLYGFTGDRPQQFSILLMALSFWCVDKAEEKSSRLPYLALPFISLIWAQIHGGVILALVLLCAYSVLWGWHQYRTSKKLDKLYLSLVLSVIAFGIATLITPNGITTYAYVFNLQGSSLQSRTSEYISSLLVYQLGYISLQIWIYITLVLALLGAIGLYRKAPHKTLLLLLLLGLSIESFRYFVFLLIVGTPYAASGVTNLAKSYFSTMPRASLFADRWGSAIALVLLLAILIGPYNFDHSQVFASRYPVNLAQKLEGQQGKILSVIRWGGYLLWHNPGIVPFVDGRMLDDTKLMPYTHMIWATREGQHWFHEQQFDWVLMPYTANDGEMYQLNLYLDKHPGWKVFTRDKQGVIFKAER